MPVRVGINGFGRIGRNIMRAALADKSIDFVAVNDLLVEPIIAAPPSPGPWRDYWLLSDYRSGAGADRGRSAYARR